MITHSDQVSGKFELFGPSSENFWHLRVAGGCANRARGADFGCRREEFPLNKFGSIFCWRILCKKLLRADKGTERLSPLKILGEIEFHDSSKELFRSYGLKVCLIYSQDIITSTYVNSSRQINR